MDELLLDELQISSRSPNVKGYFNCATASQEAKKNISSEPKFKKNLGNFKTNSFFVESLKTDNKVIDHSNFLFNLAYGTCH